MNAYRINAKDTKEREGEKLKWYEVRPPTEEERKFWLHFLGLWASCPRDLGPDSQEWADMKMADHRKRFGILGEDSMTTSLKKSLETES